MWIMIIGNTGTGKHAAAEHLQRQGFEIVERRTPAAQNTFLQQIRVSADKLRDQIHAGLVKERNNVVTIGSYWDANLVYADTLSQIEAITPEQKFILDEMYSAHREPYSLAAPHAVIWTKSKPMDAMNRMTMRGIDFDQNAFMLRQTSFEKFMERVRVPVIEVESLSDPGLVQQSIEFGINSLKATALTTGSVWSKDFFY